MEENIEENKCCIPYMTIPKYLATVKGVQILYIFEGPRFDQILIIKNDLK